MAEPKILGIVLAGGAGKRLAPLTAIGAADLDQVQIVSDQAQYEAGEMVLGHKILHRWWQKQRLIDLPGAECLAHAAGENLTRASLASKIRYYSDRLLGLRDAYQARRPRS